MKRPPRRADDALINNWTMFRYMIVGMYVGFATVGVFVTWYSHGVGGVDGTSFFGIELSGDGHKAVPMSALMSWASCDEEMSATGEFQGMSKDYLSHSWSAGGDEVFSSSDGTGCDYFEGQGKVKASTLSLSVLVTIEMFNALNALSEDGSLLTTPPWVNPYLIIAMVASFGLHFVILYVKALNPMFYVVPLNFQEWLLIILYSFPVILIDEVLKFFGRRMNASRLRERERKDKMA